MQRHKLKHQIGHKTFLSEYSDGELKLFQDMIDKLIESKKSEIYRQLLLKRTVDDPSSSSEEEEQEEEPEPTLSEEDSEGNRVVKLVPSGVVISLAVDPAESSEEEVF